MIFGDQHLAAGRARRQVPHQPPPPRAPRARSWRRTSPCAWSSRKGPIPSRSPGRGLLHLSVLIETMRREGFELAIGKPRVILHERDGVVQEPFESLVVEVPTEHMGAVMELVGARRGQLVEMSTHGKLHVPRLLDPRPRPDRPAHPTAQRDPRAGDHAPPLRGLSAHGRRYPGPRQRRARVDGLRARGGLRPRRPPGSGPRCSSPPATTSTKG